MILRTPGHQDTRTQGLRNAVRHFSVFTAATIVVFSAAPCFAQAVSSADLITRAAEYDGKTVVFQGEAIGDVMVRGGHAWVNVSDGTHALGVWMRADMARTITHTGAYRVRGDTIEVRGAFHRSCIEHGGDLDIHAEELSKVVSGARFSEGPLAAKAKIALGLGMILGALWTSGLLKKRYMRRSGQ